MDYEKSIGRVNMRKLLVKGGDLQVFQFDRNDRKKVEKMAKKYGILYSVLPGVNKEQGKMEIVFHSEAVPRVNMMIQKLKMGKMSTFDEYLREDGGKNAEELANFLEKEKKGGFREEDRVANEAIDGLLEKVGNFAMEREAVSSGLIKENFSVSQSQAQSVLSQLERMGVLSKVDERGMHKVLMDKEAFQNRIRGYRELMDRMKGEFQFRFHSQGVENSFSTPCGTVSQTKKRTKNMTGSCRGGYHPPGQTLPSCCGKVS